MIRIVSAVSVFCGLPLLIVGCLAAPLYGVIGVLLLIYSALLEALCVLFEIRGR